MDLKEIYLVCANISAFSALIPMALSIWKYKAFNTQMKIVLCYVTLSFLTDLISFALYLNHMQTTLVQMIYSMLQGVLIIYMYALQLKLRFSTHYLLQALLIILFILPFLFPSFPTSIAGSVQAATICTLGFVFFYRVFIELKIRVLSDHTFFWINTAFLFYFSSTFMLELFDNFIRTSGGVIGMYIYFVFIASNIIHYLLISIGIWKIQKI